MSRRREIGPAHFREPVSLPNLETLLRNGTTHFNSSLLWSKFQQEIELFIFSSHFVNTKALPSTTALQKKLRGTQMSKQAAEHHHKAAEHLDHASRHHREAAKHHEAGDHELAAHHAHTAQGHIHHATHHSAEAAKLHVEHHGHKVKAAGR